MTLTTSRLAALALVAAAPAVALGGGRGVPWETTMSVEMDGLALPPQRTEACRAEGTEPEPPAGPDERCTVSDLSRRGNRMTWTVSCPGPDAMSGEGELSWAATSWTGTMTLRSADGPMKVAMRGRRLPGTCDAAAPRRAAAAVEAQAAASQRMAAEAEARTRAGACRAAVDEMLPALLTGREAGCRDPGALKRFCARLGTWSGHDRLSSQGEPALRQGTAACGTTGPAALRLACADARRAAPARGTLDFVGRACPAERDALAKRECAGKDASSVSQDWFSFCATHARGLMLQHAARKEASRTAVEQGTKALRGLLGF